MPVAIIRPAVTVGMTLTPVGAGTWQCVDPGDPVVHDDDTTYAEGELNQNGDYRVQGVPEGIGVVTDFKYAHRSHNKNEAACQECCNVFANAQWGAWSLPNTGNSWITRGPTTAARPGGGSWAKADFVNSSNAFRLACYVSGNALVALPRITSLWGELYFEFELGGFVLFVSQWLPPILAVASHGLLKREIIEILGRHSTRPSNRLDFDRLFEAIRRRPTFLELRSSAL